MANSNDNPPVDKSFSGTGALGTGGYQELPHLPTPNFGSLPVSEVNNSYGGYSSSESPNIPEEPATAPIMPFQPNVYQDAENGYWYFSFDTVGVVFLPVGRATGNEWHNTWNDAWPFRPKMNDWNETSEGALKDINDADNYGGGYIERKPRILLEEGENVIYLEVTYTFKENSIADLTAGNGAYEGVRAQVPLMRTKAVTGNAATGATQQVTSGNNTEFSSHRHDLPELELEACIDNVVAPWGNGVDSNADLTPYVYVPIMERNAFVTQEPVIKVLSAGHEGETSFSVKHDTWKNTDSVRKFIWGTVYIDADTSTQFATTEWWRYDCPTYMINNHTVDGNTGGRETPLDHAATDDNTDLADPSADAWSDAPNTGLDVSV